MDIGKSIIKAGDQDRAFELWDVHHRRWVRCWNETVSRLLLVHIGQIEDIRRGKTQEWVFLSPVGLFQFINKQLNDY